MLVTLYTDASWSGDVGGWAVWLRSDHGRVIRHGPVPDYVRSSTSAELAAIFAGLHLAVTTWADTKTVLIRSDCKPALEMSTGDSTPQHRNICARRLVDRIRQVERHPIRLIPRWVKAHQTGGAVEAFINNRVDELAVQARIAHSR